MAILRFSVQMGDRLPAHTATIYQKGAIVNGTQNNVTTVTVHSGHDFEVGHKFLYALTRSNISIPSSGGVRRVFTVTAKDATHVTFSGGVFPFPDGAFLINIGPDTGGVLQNDGTYTDPNYDGSPINAYSDPAGDESYLYSSVPVEPGGDLGFWSNTADLWVLARNSRGAPVRVYIISQAASGAGGGGSAIDVALDTTSDGDDDNPTFLIVRGTATGDKLYIWAKDSADAYDWRGILEIP